MPACTCPKNSACQCDGLCTARIGIFSSLSLTDQRLLMKKARHRREAVGKHLFIEDEHCEQILVVHSGRIKLNRYTPEGREYVLDIIGAGDIYGEQWLFSGRRHEVNAIVLEDSSFCEIHRADIEELIHQHPEVGIKLLRELGSKYSRVCRMQELLSIKDAKARLAGYLLLMGLETSDHTISMTRDDLSAAINLRKETISRKLRELELAGLLRLTGHRDTHILNVDGLLGILETAEREYFS